VAEVLELHRNMSRSAARDEVIRLFGTVGISDPGDQVDTYPHQFSGGMRQRVMIAMALACNPRLLIADEPTSALDVTIQAQILELIGTLRTKIRTSIILITHDLGVVAGLADRVAVMYAGRVVEEAPTGPLFDEPQHPYTRGLLRTIPRLDRDPSHQLDAIPGRPPNPLHMPGGCPFRPRCPLAHEPCAGAYPPTVAISEEHRAACWALETGF
jgi:oligopeptide transport system ATP-binding protein